MFFQGFDWLRLLFWQALLIVTLTSKDPALIGQQRMLAVLALSGENGLMRLRAGPRGLQVTTLPGQVQSSL